MTTFYLHSKYQDPVKGTKFFAENPDDIFLFEKKFPDYSSDKISIEHDGKYLTFNEYRTMKREAGLVGVSKLWSFLEKVRRYNKKNSTKNGVYELFNSLPLEEKSELQRLYYAVENKLSDALWEAGDDYAEKHDGFSISEDGMMDFVPYLMTLGEKRVNTFIKKPHLAFNLYDTSWEYPFEFYDVFLWFDAEQNNNVSAS